MTDKETKEIDEEMTSRLPKDLSKMFLKKSVDASVYEVTAKGDFVVVKTLVDIPNTTRTIRVFVILDKSTLYSAGCCTKLDIRGGIDSYALKQADFVELRVLRVAFEAMKAIYKGTVNAPDKGRALNVSFSSKDGTILYY